MARIDHTNCIHPRTPAGRRACRAGNAAPLVLDGIAEYARTHRLSPDAENGMRVAAAQVVAADDYIAADIRRQAANNRVKMQMDRRYDAQDEIRMTGPVARRMARTAAAADRIQPRRGGARVSARSTSCVQAALHTSGRCACGWHAANFCNTDVYACAGH